MEVTAKLYMGIFKHGSSIFSFKNYKVNIKEERLVDFNQNKGSIENLKLWINNQEQLSFQYENGLGLIVKSNTKQCNVLGELLKIKNNDIIEYEKFIQNYGFFFNLEPNKFYEISPSLFSTYSNRLRALTELINEINNDNEIDIFKIMNLSLFLLFGQGWEFYVGDYRYSSYEYELVSMINNAQGAYPETINKQQAINTGNYTIDDTIYDSYELSAEEYNEIVNMTTKNPDLNDFRFASLTYLYANNKNNDYKKYIDIIYHWFREYGVPSNFKYNKIEYLNKTNKNKINEHIFFDGIIALGKYIINCEINHGIENIKPYCDLETMEPKWIIPSLNNALYFSLFYLDKKKQMYKPCSYCGAYFIVNRSTSSRLYCDKYCRNNAQQAAHRLKLKQIKKTLEQDSNYSD